MYMNTLEFHMDAISYTAARANLAKTMARVCNDHAPIIITRKSEDHAGNYIFTKIPCKC